MTLLIAILVGYGLVVLWDFRKYIRKSSAALDRDQQILDQVEALEPDDDEDDAPQFAIDMSLDERDATLQFIEQFREIRKHYGIE